MEVTPSNADETTEIDKEQPATSDVPLVEVSTVELDKGEKRRKSSHAVPDGGWGWMVVIGSTIIHFLIVGMGRSFGVFYLDMLDRFHGSSAATSWVVAIYNSLRMGFGPIAGILCDRYTCRKVVIVGGLIAASGCVITAFATSLIYAYFSFGLITGIGASLLFAPSYIIVSQYFDKNKGKAMGISTIGAGLGTIGLAPLIQTLLQFYDFFGAMLVLGALMLNNCIAGLLFRPLSDSTSKPQPAALASEPDDGTSSVCKEVKTIGEILKSQFGILRNTTFLFYGFQVVCMSICTQVFFCFLPAIAEQYGTERTKAALLLSVMGFADMAGRILFGVFFDLKSIRYRRRLFHTILGYPLAISVFLTGFLNTYSAFCAITIFFGLVEGGFHSQRATIISEFVSKDQMTSTVAFVIFFQGGGIILGPPVGGLLRDIYNTYNVCYFYGGATMAVSSTVFLAEYFLKDKLTKRKSTTDEESIKT